MSLSEIFDTVITNSLRYNRDLSFFSQIDFSCFDHHVEDIPVIVFISEDKRSIHSS